MLLDSISHLLCISLILGVGLSSCGKWNKSHNDLVRGPGSGNIGDGDTYGGVITLGQVFSPKGNVERNENGIFSLTKHYTFKLDREMTLQVRKVTSSKSCGQAHAHFFILKGDESVDSASTDPDKTYKNAPMAKMRTLLNAGDYTLVSFFELDQECKELSYSFVLEQSKEEAPKENTQKSEPDTKTSDLKSPDPSTSDPEKPNNTPDTNKPETINPDPNEGSTITLGQENSVKGDVVKDENEMFSLTKVYSFRLSKETTLQVRKVVSNDLCGRPYGSFFIEKNEEVIVDVTIDKDKPYSGFTVAKFAGPIGAGDYTLVAFMTLDRECKDLLFSYYFVLEESK